MAFTALSFGVRLPSTDSKISLQRAKTGFSNCAECEILFFPNCAECEILFFSNCAECEILFFSNCTECEILFF